MSIKDYIKNKIKILDESFEYENDSINNDLIKIVECENDTIEVIDTNKNKHCFLKSKFLEFCCKNNCNEGCSITPEEFNQLIENYLKNNSLNIGDTLVIDTVNNTTTVNGILNIKQNDINTIRNNIILNVEGNANIIGNLDVEKDTTLNQKLNVIGDTTVLGDTRLNNLTVSGDLELDSIITLLTSLDGKLSASNTSGHYGNS